MQYDLAPDKGFQLDFGFVRRKLNSESQTADDKYHDYSSMLLKVCVNGYNCGLLLTYTYSRYSYFASCTDK